MSRLGPILGTAFVTYLGSEAYRRHYPTTEMAGCTCDEKAMAENLQKLGEYSQLLDERSKILDKWSQMEDEACEILDKRSRILDERGKEASELLNKRSRILDEWSQMLNSADTQGGIGGVES